MFSRIKFIVLSFILMMFTAFPAVAQVQQLQTVIDKYCKKQCISAQQLMSIANKAGQSYKIDPAAILAIVHTESKYHLRAKNGSSVGLSQVLLTYHRSKFRTSDYYNAEDNIFAGMKVLSDCLKRKKGNYPLAFRCYNGGGDPKYVSKITVTYSMMKDIVKPSVDPDPLGTFITTQLD